VRLELHDDGKVPAQINLLVRVHLGPAYPLGPLTVTGATALPTEDIADGFRHGKWYTAWQLPQPFRRGVLRQDITNLVAHYRRIGFPGVRVQDDFDPNTSLDLQAKNVRLAIDIRERKHVEVAFEGNNTRSAGALLETLTLLTHGATTMWRRAASATALEHSYLESGYMLVKVTWRRERISEQSDRLVFVIDEGPLLKVRSVSFVGNRAIPSDVLAEHIRTHVYPFLGFLGLGEGGFASLRQLELDVQSLVDHYAAVGYPDTKVRAEIAPRPGEWRPLPNTIEQAEEAVWRNANSLHVRFIIEEANLLWVAGMEFQCVVPGEKLPRDDDFFHQFHANRCRRPLPAGIHQARRKPYQARAWRRGIPVRPSGSPRPSGTAIRCTSPGNQAGAPGSRWPHLRARQLLHDREHHSDLVRTSHRRRADHPRLGASAAQSGAHPAVQQPEPH
jgi:hypothetical protein